MDRSPNPEAAIRERVTYCSPTTENGSDHIYIWPYDTHWSGNFGVLVEGYQVEIDLAYEPPKIEIIHLSNIGVNDYESRQVSREEALKKGLDRLIEEDFGPEAIGLEALKAYVRGLSDGEQ